MKTEKSTTAKKPVGTTDKKDTTRKSSSTAAAAKSKDMPPATDMAKARSGKTLRDEGTIPSYESDR